MEVQACRGTIGSHPTAIQQEPEAVQKIEPQSVSMVNSQGLSIG